MNQRRSERDTGRSSNERDTGRSSNERAPHRQADTRQGRPAETRPGNEGPWHSHEGEWRSASPRGERSHEGPHDHARASERGRDPALRGARPSEGGRPYPSRGFAWERENGRPLHFEGEAGARGGTYGEPARDMYDTRRHDEALRPYRDNGTGGAPRPYDARRDDNVAYGVPTGAGFEGGDRYTEPRMGRSRFSRDHEAANAPAAESRSFRAPKGYTRSDDRIREDVCDRIGALSGVDASDVEVSVKDGEVHLSGHVEDRWQKHQIENEADRVSGVKEITNLVRLHRSKTTRGVEPSDLTTPKAQTSDGANAAPTRTATS